MIHIPTQNYFYSNEAAAILAEISMYPGILEEQLLRLHADNTEQLINILRYLQKHNRIKKDMQLSYYPSGNTLKSERDAIIRRVWVLLEFIPNVDYHSASDFPVAISFFTRGEEYQIIHASEESEGMVCAVIAHQKNIIAKRLVLVDNPEQIPHIIFPGIIGYCTATIDGQVQYYKLK